MEASKRAPGSKRFVTYLVILVLVAGWIVTIGWFSTPYNDQIRVSQELTAESAAVRLQLEQLGATVSNFEHSLQHQTALIARITGDVVALQMPEAWGEQLTNLENIASSQESWPQSAQDAENFIANVRALIADIPTWAEPYYIERLVNLRWAGFVFVETNPPPDDSQQDYLEGLQSRFDNLLELETIAPSTVDQKMMDFLVEYTGALQADSAPKVRAASIEKANRVLSSSGETDPELTTLLPAYAWLERLEEDHEIKELKSRLSLRMMEIDVQRQVDEAVRRHEALKAISLRTNDSEILEQGTRLILGELGAARGRLAFEGASNEVLNTQYRRLEQTLLEIQHRAYEAETTKHQEAISRYQSWALSKIRHAENEYERAKWHADRLMRPEKWTDAEFNIVRDAMLKLLEVDTRFLDWSLAELYQQTMSAGSATLIDNKGESTRRTLAEMSVSVKKKPLGFDQAN